MRCVELTIAARAQIVPLAEARRSYTQISDQLSVSKSTISKTLKKWQTIFEEIK